VKGTTFWRTLRGILYMSCWVHFGLATFRKGHCRLFWVASPIEADSRSASSRSGAWRKGRSEVRSIMLGWDHITAADGGKLDFYRRQLWDNKAQ
jgi:hypothetical protein